MAGHRGDQLAMTCSCALNRECAAAEARILNRIYFMHREMLAFWHKY